MKIKPVLTEKSMSEAKDGRYTFWVDLGATKGEIKSTIAKAFGVKVSSVATMNYKPGRSRNFRGVWRKQRARKKAVVTLSGKDRIDIFDQK